MATGTKSQQSSATPASQQPAEHFFGGYINPTDGTVRLTTDPTKLPELRLEACARW